MTSLEQFLTRLRIRLQSTYLDMTDKALLSRYVDHEDQDAFAALVVRHAGAVLRTCYQVLRDPAEVEDVVQATFVVLTRQAGRVPWQESITRWLVSTAHRLAVEAQRRNRRRTQHEQRAVRVVDPRLEGGDLSWQEACTLVHEELDRLPKLYREVLILFYVQDQSRDEVAQLLGCSVGAVKGRLERGRHLLAKRLQRRGITLTVMVLTGARAAVLSGSTPLRLLPGVLQAVEGSMRPGVAALVQGATAMVWMNKTLSVAAGLLLVFGVGYWTCFAGMSGDGGETIGANPPEVPGKTEQFAVDRFGDPLPTGKLARLGTKRFCHNAQVLSVAASADEKTVAVKTPSHVTIWEATSGKRLHPWKVHSSNVDALPRGQFYLALTPDGKYFVTPGEESTIEFRRVATGDLVRTFRGHGEPVEFSNHFLFTHGRLVFTGDGHRLISLGDDATLRIWDVATGRELHRLGQLDGKIRKKWRFPRTARRLSRR